MPPFDYGSQAKNSIKRKIFLIIINRCLRDHRSQSLIHSLAMTNWYYASILRSLNIDHKKDQTCHTYKLISPYKEKKSFTLGSYTHLQSRIIQRKYLSFIYLLLQIILIGFSSFSVIENRCNNWAELWCFNLYLINLSTYFVPSVYCERSNIKKV